jgi:hypothetical protein
LKSFNQKLKNNSISTFCVTKIFVQVTKTMNIYIEVKMKIMV